jgi:hypothetical protein
MYVCIDQNCGVTTEGGEGEEEEEEANISLLFLPFTRSEREREREEATVWTDIFLSFTTAKKKGRESKVKVI